MGPEVLKASDGNSGKKLTSQEKHCIKFSQWLHNGLSLDRKGVKLLMSFLLLAFIEIEICGCVDGVSK